MREYKVFSFGGICGLFNICHTCSHAHTYKLIKSEKREKDKNI